MSHIKIKLKEDAVKDFLTTPNGVVVGKEDFTVVDDDNIHVQYLLKRNDIIIEDVKDDVKKVDDVKVDVNKDHDVKVQKSEEDDSKKTFTKPLNEGSVSDSMVDNDLYSEEDD